MHLVAIHGWQEESPELVQALASELGILPFEARQRLLAGNPSIVALYASEAPAQALAQRLLGRGFAVQVIDRDRQRSAERHQLRYFAFDATALQIETSDGISSTIPYAAIELLVTAIGPTTSGIIEQIVERKFSLGKSLLAGGVPLTKKVTRQETLVAEVRSRMLYLYAMERPPLLCVQPQLDYAGLGADLQLTQEANFTRFLAELRRRAPAARCDERLLNRATQIRLLGALRETEPDLDLAAAVLAGALRA